MIDMAQHSRYKLVAFAVLAFLLTTVAPASEKSVEALKADAEKATGGHQARLYAELAQQLVETANQQFTDGQVDAAQSTVQEVLKYAALARDILQHFLNRRLGGVNLPVGELLIGEI